MADPDRSKVSKQESEYVRNATEAGAPPGARCENCAHYVPGNATSHGDPICKVVEGRVGPNAVCFGFYADFGVFADNRLADGVRTTMVLERGGVSTWTRTDAQAFVRQMEQEIQQLRG